MTKADQLARALDEFLTTSPDIEAAAVVSADGLPMASALPPHVEEDRLAAMSAAILTLGERAAMGLGKGGLQQVFVEGEEGYVVLMAAGENAVLVAVTSQGAKVGLLLFEMRRAAGRVATVMDSVATIPDAPTPPAPPQTQTVSGGPESSMISSQPIVEAEEIEDSPDLETQLSEVSAGTAFGGKEQRSEYESGNAW